MPVLRDSHGRILRDLRVSITDRCDLRCFYCLPATGAVDFFSPLRQLAQVGPGQQLRPRLSRADILTFEEIERVVRLAVGLGIQKIRLTGGEPMLRKEVEHLVARLAPIAGLMDLAMTTNGLCFGQKARALRKAGLQRISFSLDSLDRANFQKITGRDALAEVLANIALARELGFSPVKINAVIIRGLNDHEILPLAEFAHEHNFALRFIEYMPLDEAHLWQRELVVPGREIIERLHTRYSLPPIEAVNPSETAKKWRFADGRGEIGIITTISEPFCSNCNRLRLTADGKLRTCLFSPTEYDLRSRLRAGASDEELAHFLQAVVTQKEPGHRIGQPDFLPPPRRMSCIGG